MRRSLMFNGRQTARALRVRTLFLALLVAAALATPSALRAQEPRDNDAREILIGAGAAIGTGSVTASIPVYGNDPTCGSFEKGTATPFAPSLSLRLPRLFSNDFGIAIRLGAILQSAEFVAAPADPQRAVDPAGNLVDVDRELQLESSLTTLALDLPATRALGNLSLAVGPTVGLFMGREETTRDVVNAPAFVAAARGEREVEGASTLSGSALAFGALADVSYALELSDRVVLSPHVELRLGLTSPYVETTWQQLTIGGGVDLLFDITPRPAVVVPVAVVVDTPRTVAIVERPTVVVALKSVDSTGAILDGPAEVIYRDVVERRHLPLIPAIFFDSASTRMPQRVRTLEADSKPADVAAVLAELSTLEAQTHLLNIVGERLRANRNLGVTLVGSTSGDEDRAIARARAEAVRAYLADVWRVDPSQVAIDADNRVLKLSSEATPEGRAENRRVEIVARDLATLRPVLIERRIEQAILPVALMLRVAPSAPARWSARIIDRSGEVKRVDTTSERAMLITLEPDQITPQAPSLTAHVNVAFARPGEASQSQSVSIPLTWRSERTIIQGSIERLADRERTTWQLLGFNFNSPDVLDRHRDELRAMVAMIADSAHVVVTGYSDRLGDEKRNLELSRERAERVAGVLRDELVGRGNRTVTVDVVGAGVDETRFSNDLPEGRFLSRGVTIVAEQRAQ
jgi:outer membrane protein OmpA-like peptidoglycan-associated protein